MANNNIKIAVGAFVILVIVIAAFFLMRRRDNYQYPTGQLYPSGNYSANPLWGRNAGGGGVAIPQPNVNSLVMDNSGNINISTPVPVGGIIMWAGSIASIPTGWGLCNGSTYGVAPNQITSPDLTSRFVVGAGTSSNPNQYITTYGVGDNGGEEFHQLTVEEMPSHTHTVSAALTTHANNTLFDNATLPNPYNGGVTTDPAGGDPDNSSATLPHNNMPPYYALAYIIKYM